MPSKETAFMKIKMFFIIEFSRFHLSYFKFTSTFPKHLFASQYFYNPIEFL